MDRSPSREEKGLKKGPWTPEEDEKLIQHIQKHGLGSWRALPKLAGLNRCGKSCRLRWTNYLRPDIKRGKFSQDEEQTILHLHSILGNKWSAISTHLPGRTDNEIKNFWNTHLKKKLIQMGFDPMTHQPRTDLFSSLPHLMAFAYNLKDHDLLNHHPLMDLQLLHTLLLQSTASTSYSIPQNGNDIVGDDHHVEPLINLLNSVDIPPMKENQVSNLFSHDPNEYLYNDCSGGTITTSPQPLHQYPALSSHPDPQKVSFSFQPSLNSDHHHEHEEIMGERLGNPDHTIIISPHDHHINHDHDSATWFLPPLYTSNILPNLIDHEDLMSNNVIIPRDSTSTTMSSYGGPSCTTTSNSHWPADQLFS